VKVEALARLLQARGRSKVFVTTREFCLCGMLSNLRAAGDSHLVDVGASVRVLRSGELLAEPLRSGSLQIDTGTLLTRRLQTHRRHVHERVVPDDYWRRAAAL
jgi:hypothetical protein